jgi:Spy/CpxP family protein refolding chaperone
MKKILVFVVAFMTASSVLAGEGMGKKGNDEGREGRKQEMVQLNLSETQKAQMKTLREKHRVEKQAMREKHKAEVKSILTPEQSAKFEQRQQERAGMKDDMAKEEGQQRGKGMKNKKDREESKSEQQ